MKNASSQALVLGAAVAIVSVVVGAGSAMTAFAIQVGLNPNRVLDMQDLRPEDASRPIQRHTYEIHGAAPEQEDIEVRSAMRRVYDYCVNKGYTRSRLTACIEDHLQ